MIRWLLRAFFGKQRKTAAEDPSIRRVIEAERERQRVDYGRIGEYPFDHYTDATEEVKQLKREKAHDEALALLDWCMEFVEDEANHHKSTDYPAGIAPWYYRHAAIVHRKERDYSSEISVLERYVAACRMIGATPKDELTERLQKARELASQ